MASALEIVQKYDRFYRYAVEQVQQALKDCRRIRRRFEAALEDQWDHSRSQPLLSNPYEDDGVTVLRVEKPYEEGTVISIRSEFDPSGCQATVAHVERDLMYLDQLIASDPGDDRRSPMSMYSVAKRAEVVPEQPGADVLTVNRLLSSEYSFAMSGSVEDVVEELKQLEEGLEEAIRDRFP